MILYNNHVFKIKANKYFHNNCIKFLKCTILFFNMFFKLNKMKLFLIQGLNKNMLVVARFHENIPKVSGFPEDHCNCLEGKKA